MIVEHPIFHLARLTLEAKTAHGIQSGRGDSLHDVLLLRDANGLPAIPGTSLAGVLRHAYSRAHGEAAADLLFGTISGDGRPSPLSVDWGIVHDSHDRPREGLLDPAALADPLLAYLQQDKPIVRQRVRLNHRGAASATGKFDVTLLPAGVRYTHWLSYSCDEGSDSAKRWEQLLDLIRGGSLQLGHGGRSGNGHFRVIELHAAEWNLRTPEGRLGFSQRPRHRQDRNGLSAVECGRNAGDALHVDLKLQAEAGWRIGGGEHSLTRHDKEPDLLPQHEPRIEWSEGQGRIGNELHLLPGSAVKGALRHRVAFHYRRLRGEWADESLLPTDECLAVKQLFGSSSGETGIAGQLLFEDILLPATQTAVLMHNRIDRFTGGVIHGALFSEEVLWQTSVNVRVTILADRDVDALARQAFQCALTDLCKGRLPLGAAGSRGLGTFVDPEGHGPVWSDGGAWVRSGQMNDTRSDA